MTRSWLHDWCLSSGNRLAVDDHSFSFVIPLVVAGFFCVLGAGVYLFMVGEIAPLPALEPPVRTPAE